MAFHPDSHSHARSRAAFFLYGGCALIAQLVCLQELLIVFAGHELFLGFSLAAWMGWVGAGSALARHAGVPRFNRLVVASTPLLLATVLMIRLTKNLFGFGMLVGLLPMVTLTTILLAPIGLTAGALFVWGCAWAHERNGLSIGAAYLWETLGAACGGVVYSALTAGRLTTEWTLVVFAAPATLVAWALLGARQRWRSEEHTSELQ